MANVYITHQVPFLTYSQSRHLLQVVQALLAVHLALKLGLDDSFFVVHFLNICRYEMSSSFEFYLGLSSPAAVSEAFMQHIMKRRESRQERVKAVKSLLTEALDEVKRRVVEVEKDITDEEACCKLQRATDHVVCCI